MDSGMIPQQISETGPGPILALTEQAVDYIKKFSSKSPENQKKTFRVYVEGGGCSGFQYGFSFDEKKPEDLVIQCGDVNVLVDPQSRLYLNGSTVDYTEDFRGSGFVVKNPNSKGSCGCGVSFTV